MGKEAFPVDIQFRPRLSVIGLPATGKSELCKKISEITGAVHLQLETMIEDMVERDSTFCQKIQKRLKGLGKEIDDLFMIQVI